MKVVAVDIGGTKTSLAIIENSPRSLSLVKGVKKNIVMHRGRGKFNIMSLKEFSTLKNPRDVISQIKKELKNLDPGGNLTLGIAICGLLSPDRKMLLKAPNLGWRNISITELLSPLNRKWVIVNDGTAAAWGSYITQSGQDVKNLLSVTLGTGVGGGVVIGGSLLFGAGELGHIKIAYEGPKCCCGSRGCLEVYAGGEHIPSRVKEWYGLNVKSVEELYNLAENHSEDAVMCFKKIGSILGWALAGVVNLNGIEAIYIGGRITTAYKYWLDDLKNSLEKNLIISEYQKCKVYISRWKNNMSLIGAACIVISPANIDK